MCVAPLKDLQNGSVADPLRAACVDVKSADDSNFTSRVSHHCRKQSKRLIVVWFFFFSANDASYKQKRKSKGKRSAVHCFLRIFFNVRFLDSNSANVHVTILFINMEFRGTFHVVDWVKIFTRQHSSLLWNTEVPVDLKGKKDSKPTNILWKARDYFRPLNFKEVC